VARYLFCATGMPTVAPPSSTRISAPLAAATVVAGLACALLSPPSALAQTPVLTQHNDHARTGANLDETVLTTTTVNVSQFGKLFERTVDDEIYGQPLYVPGVTIPGVGVRNVVYVATNNDSVYAFDADNPAATAPLWRVTYTNPAANILPFKNTDVGQACGTYRDFVNNIGIVGTGTIDQTTGTWYFVVRTKENGVFTQRLHAVDIATGAARPGSPKLIQASVPGTGDGRDANGNIPFNARTQNQRAGLLIENGTVYIAWASYCDQGPYHGWILGYDAATLNQTVVYNTSPNGGLAGIWQSGGGLTADDAGNIYAITGNGSFNGDVAGGVNFGNSFLKVSPTGTLVDWFTPFNWSFLNATDEDLGAQNPLLIPNSNLMVGGGKEGVLYVLDRNNLGHFRSDNNSQIVQSFQASSSGRMNGSPVFWNGPGYGPSIYLWPAGDPLKVYRLVDGRFITPASAQSTVLAPGGMPGGMLSLSANGGTAGTGILWATVSISGDANHTPRAGILRAFDASNLTRELWNSEQNAARDALGLFSKFAPPTIADGKVFVPTLSNKLVVYGLLAPSSGNTAPTANAGADQTITPEGTSPAVITLTGTATDDGNPNPPSVLTTTWSLASGPGAVTFGSPNALTTTASFTVPGTYIIRLSAFDGEATASDDVIVTVNAPAGSGTGLLAQYFNDAGSGIYFTALVLTRTDATVDFNWGAASPAPAVQADNFSVRWSGQVQAPVSGTYTFSTLSDDGVRLYVNGQPLVDNWTEHGATTNSGTITLVGGQRYDIRMDFFDKVVDAVARLSWTYPGQNDQVIPQWALYPSLPVNHPPAVNAGPDRVVSMPSATASLAGLAQDDGLPSPPGAVTIQWTKISGREDSDGGTVTFANPNAAATTATFGADGIYVLRLAISDGAVTVSDDVTVTVTPAPVIGNGTGLQGEYFNDPNNGQHFVTPRSTRVDAGVNFSWGTQAPTGANVTADNFSVRWTGQVQATLTGNYTFTTTADDGVRLWVNNVLVIDNWVDQGATSRTSAAIALVAGTKYDIRMEYYEHGGDAVARLQWTTPTQPLAAIPQSQLYPPAAPPAVPGLTAQFFNDPNNGATHLGTVALTRVDTTVNYAWGTASPATGITANYFSARWSGKVQPSVTGSYRFRTVSDDGVRLWVNGVQVINNWTDHSPTTNTSNTITLTAGVKYNIVLEYYEKGGDATIRLQWQAPGSSSYVTVPSSRLFTQ
jgi:hypothetical protein